ncbi:MAG TPA: tetratricopeptide repeat protein [Solirubrobacteraceae bacterium]|jgi:tetratricopeptide (TPR) repeat protein
MIVPGAPLFINRDPDLDWLIALEYGRVCDGHPSGQFRPVSEQFAWMLDRPGGRRIVGFCVHGVRAFNPEAHGALWRGPRFDAPLFGLTNATAGAIILATQAALLDEPTTNRCFFTAAVSAEGDEALTLWRQCLECGDQMAHYGLGYTLLALDRPREAYGHLRFYTELSPANGWAWCFLGQACEALGDPAEARTAYARAVELEQRGGEETDASDRLNELEGERR